MLHGFLYVLCFFSLRGALLLPSLYDFCGQVLRKTMLKCHVTFERIFQKNQRVALHLLPGLLACRPRQALQDLDLVQEQDTAHAVDTSWKQDAIS